MPIRSYAQQIGDAGQALVEDFFRHPRWLARTQSHDFGIDLEAELADPIGDNKQRMTGKLIKLQIKASARVEQGLAKITYPVPRALIHYADAFRLPVILAIACLETRTVWWLWLQEWSVLNEERLRRDPEAATLAVHIPVDQTLERDLDATLPAVAMGSTANATILALRNVIEAASGWDDRAMAKGVARLLGQVHGRSRGWILQKVTDKLLAMGEATPFWQAQQVLLIPFGLIDVAGESFSRDQVIRLVGRGDRCSRTGLAGLSRLYDLWPEQMRALALVDGFANAGTGEIAWYCAMRERYPTKPNDFFGMSLMMMSAPDLSHGGYRIELNDDVKDYVFAKWPNRGDSVLLDCLIIDTSSTVGV